MGVEGRTSGGGVFLRGQLLLQLGIFFIPVFFAGVKGVGQTAPANVVGEDFLLCRGGASSLGLNGLEGLNGLQVGAELGLGAAFAQMVVGDVEVPRRRFFQCIFQHLLGSNSFRIRHDLLDKGVLIQFLLVCHLTVHNAPLRQRLPDQGAVQIQHRIRECCPGIGHRDAARPAGEVLLQLGIFLGVLLTEIPFAVDEMPQQLVRLFPG